MSSGQEHNQPPRGRKAAVLGSPIAHSRSPQLHLAAYRALGLTDWTYQRIECDAAQLPAVVGGFGPEWVGVSVTMPGKFAALQFADERTARTELVGSANTLVRTPRGWRADNTDIDGVAGALGQASGPAIVCGSGGTAPAAVVGLAELGVTEITIAARNADKAARLVDLGARLGVASRFCGLDDPSWASGPHPRRRWSAPFRPRWRHVTRPPSPRSRWCWMRSTTRGRHRWRPPWPPRVAG
ncbi:shikimate-5-dehydrogenase [Mycobacterium ulcerans str. Harvey]|uniref:Shikimate-5-dehydrogenase n=1 Tax=Mycobacterium ulcerans str. Harvey TaxID=1299332 RepID=A0ABN0R0R4_MYCUL|nr:shikimate-5-dehydrogenase [Mycobacterium ulcerans str. Harvey]